MQKAADQSLPTAMREEAAVAAKKKLEAVAANVAEQKAFADKARAQGILSPSAEGAVGFKPSTRSAAYDQATPAPTPPR